MDDSPSHRQLVPHLLSGVGRSAACQRILVQDTAYIRNWSQQNAVLPDVQITMLAQLQQHCGAPDSGMPGQLELYALEGASLVRMYANLAYDDRLQWLVTDLSVREAIQAKDERDGENDSRWRAEVHFRTVDAEIDDAATMHRVRINAEQIEHLSHMLRCQPAQKVDEARRAMHSRNVSIDWPPEAGWISLAQRASNLPSIQAVPPTQQLKRKREEDVSSSFATSSPNEDEADNEDALQRELDALQARIAAKRARKERVDPQMPAKTAKDTSDQAVQADPSLPRPPSHCNHTYATKLSCTQGCDVKALPGAASEAAAPAYEVRLILKRHGCPDFKCRVKSSTPIAKILSVAMKQFMIPLGRKICLHFEGQRLSAAELVFEAGLPDFAWLQVSDLPLQRQRDSLNPKGNKLEISPTKAAAKQSVVDLTSSSPVQFPDAPPVPPPLPARIEPSLCQEQQEVVDAILAGQNVFYTGSAGCGKSTVLKAFVPYLRDMGKTVRIVAPTGKAALDINGSTTWTYAGWTPTHMKRPLKDLIQAAHGKFVSKRFNSTDVLVIDEISMVENHLLARLNAIMKAARKNDRPFGGVQLVVTGDFCQLPPVRPFAFCMHCGMEQIKRIGHGGETLYRCPKHGDCNDDDKWAFRSSVWAECNFKHVNLSRIHRQSDQVFIGILQKLRIGKPLTNADRQLLLDHPCDVKNAVKLFPTREEVRRINQLEFDQLRTAKREYRCLDYFSWNQEHGNLREKGRRSPIDGSLDALREHRLDSLIEFKAGMLVVLLVNLDITNGLVNGSQGRVIGFEPYAESKLPKAASREGENYSSFSRAGRSKASQRGRGSPEPSQAAVQGELRGEYAVLREGQIKEFILQSRNQNKMWPIVEFDNGLRRTIYGDCQVNELGDEKPYTLLARTQIPLLAAWAMTIHKSQGMTLNKVIVDLNKSFEEGQEYVALSRARSLDGLKVISLGGNIKGGNEQVKQFLKAKFNIG